VKSVDVDCFVAGVDEAACVSSTVVQAASKIVWAVMRLDLAVRWCCGWLVGSGRYRSFQCLQVVVYMVFMHSRDLRH